MIELRNVSKYYGEKKAVDNLSFSVKEGQIFGFLGPNGAGKTTSMKMMIGLLRPSEGNILLDGLDVWKNRKGVHQQIGVVFENPNLYLKSSIKANLKLFADIYGVKSNRILEVMDRLQLTDKQNEKVGNLSKGWRQRVLIGRALLHNPKILFLDEPTSGLDPNTTALIRNYIKDINENGTTIVLTTHDMHEADELSHYVGIMYNGRLAAVDTTEQLKEKYAKDTVYVKYMEGNQMIEKELPSGTKETELFLNDLIAKGAIKDLRNKESTLAEVFSAVTGGELS